MKKRRLSDAYRFKGFVPEHEVQEVVTDAGARTIRLKRRQKKRYVQRVAKAAWRIMIARNGSSATFPAAIYVSTLKSKFDGYTVNGARQ